MAFIVIGISIELMAVKEAYEFRVETRFTRGSRFRRAVLTGATDA